MSRLPVVANKRKKKKKERRGALDTYLDFGSLLYKRLEDSLIKDPVKISDAYVIEELVVPKCLPSISVSDTPISTSVPHSTFDFWPDATTRHDEEHLADFKCGDRVELTSRRHGSSENNPYFKGDYATVGTVLGESKENNWIKVKWDNGSSNNYELEDLSFYSMTQCKSIW